MPAVTLHYTPLSRASLSRMLGVLILRFVAALLLAVSIILEMSNVK